MSTPYHTTYLLDKTSVEVAPHGQNCHHVVDSDVWMFVGEGLMLKQEEEEEEEVKHHKARPPLQHGWGNWYMGGCN